MNLIWSVLFSSGTDLLFGHSLKIFLRLLCYYCVFLCYRQTCSTVAIPGNRCWGYCALCHHLHLREEEEPWDGGWSWWWWWSCVSALYISWSSENFEWDKMQNWSANQLFWLTKVVENCVKNEQSSVLINKKNLWMRY